MSFDPYGASSGAAMRNIAGSARDHSVPERAGSALPAGESLQRLLGLVAGRAYLLALSLLLSVVGVASQLVVPVLVGRAIDAMVGAGQVDFALIRANALGCAIAIVVAAASQWAQAALSSRLAQLTAKDLRERSFAKLGSVPMGSIDSHPHGDLIVRITADADQLADGLAQGLTQLVGGIAAIASTICFMLATSVPMGLLVIALTPISVLTAAAIARSASSSFAAQQAIQGELAGYSEEHVSNQALVFAFGFAGRAREAFSEINGRLYVAGEHAQFMSSLANPGTRLANNLIYAVVAFVGALGVMGAIPVALTLGQMQAFLSYSAQYTKPFNEISGVLTQVQGALASAGRIFALLDAEEEEDAPAALDAAVEGMIEVEHVSFAYEESKPVLRDVSMRAEPGERIALVGPTGCGKTTLVNLLLRFYDPREGRILVDGDDIAGLSRESVRRAFGMVLQDTWLFEGTVAENIAYGRPDASRGQIVAAAKRARAHAFISLLPQGYDTVLGEGASRISQGERQLLCIARTMLQDPPMLILDEATSAIDARTELLVSQAFDELMRGRTSFVIAHRLSTVRSASRIYVMREGRIVESGTHDELIAQGGIYASMCSAQSL